MGGSPEHINEGNISLEEGSGTPPVGMQLESDDDMPGSHRDSVAWQPGVDVGNFISRRQGFWQA